MRKLEDECYGLLSRHLRVSEGQPKLPLPCDSHGPRFRPSGIPTPPRRQHIIGDAQSATVGSSHDWRACPPARALRKQAHPGREWIAAAGRTRKDLRQLKLPWRPWHRQSSRGSSATLLTTLTRMVLITKENMATPRSVTLRARFQFGMRGAESATNRRELDDHLKDGKKLH